MSAGPVRIYLDSSDYSVMTDPRGVSSEMRRVRDTFCELARDARVEFVYSAVHISEMTPLDSQYSDAASARADLLSDLCGTNALIPFTQLYRSEFARLAARTEEALSVVSKTGDWFEPMEFPVEEIRPNWDQAVQDAVDHKFHSGAISRAHRRHIASLSRKAKAQSMRGNGNFGAVQELLEKWPMRPRDANVLARFAAGGSSQKEVQAAFLAGLRDPRYMMRWFRSDSAARSSVSALLRNPAQDAMESVRKLATDIFGLRELDGSQVQSFLSGRNWSEQMNLFLVNILKRLTTELGFEIDGYAVDDIEKYCPGFTTQIRTLGSVIKTSAESSRLALNSDFVDGAHSLYAPYISVFRADRFMAPIIAKWTKEADVKVTSKLGDVPKLVEGMLS